MKNNLQEELLRVRTLMNINEGVIDPKDAYKIYQEVGRRWDWSGLKGLWDDITQSGAKEGEDIYKLVNAERMAQAGEYLRKFDNLYKEIGERVGRNLDTIISKGGKNLTDEEIKVLDLFQNLINKQKSTFTQAEKTTIRNRVAESAVKGENINKMITDVIDEAEQTLTSQGIKGVKGSQIIDNVLKNVISKWETATGKKMPQEMINKLREQIIKDPKFKDLVTKFGDKEAKELAEKEAKELAEKEAELERLAKEKAEKEAFGENWRDNLMPKEATFIKVVDWLMGRNDSWFGAKYWRRFLEFFRLTEIADRIIVQVQKWKESGVFKNFNAFKANVEDTMDMTNRFTRNIRAIWEDETLNEAQKKQQVMILYRQYQRYVMKVSDTNMNKEVRDQLFQAYNYIETQFKEALYREKSELKKLGTMTDEEIDIEVQPFKDLIDWFTSSGDDFSSVQEHMKMFLNKIEKESIGTKQIGSWENFYITLKDLLGLSFKTTDEYYDDLVTRMGEDVSIVGGGLKKNLLKGTENIGKLIYDFFNSLIPRFGVETNIGGKTIKMVRWPIAEQIGQKLINKFRSGCFSDFDVLTRYWTRYGYFKGSLALFLRGTMIFYVWLPMIGSLAWAITSWIQSLIPDGPVGSVIKETLGLITAFISNPKDGVLALLGNDEARKNFELRKDGLDDARKSFVLGFAAEMSWMGLVERGYSNIPFFNTLLSYTNIFNYDGLKSEISELLSGGIGSGAANFVSLCVALYNSFSDSVDKQESFSEMSEKFENERQKVQELLNKLNGKTVTQTFPTVKTVLDKKVEKAKEAKEQIQYCTITKAQSNLITSLMTYDPYFDTKLGNINAKDVNMIQNMEFLAANAVYATGVLLNGKFFNLVHCEGGLLPILKRGENGLYGAETTSDGKLALSGVVNYKNLGSKLTMGKGNNQCYCPLCWFLYDGENGQWYTIEGWAQTFIPTGKVEKIKDQVEKADAEDVWFDFSKGFDNLIKLLKSIYSSEESIKYWQNILKDPEYQEKKGFGLKGSYSKKYANLRQTAKEKIQQKINETETLLKDLDKISEAQNTRVQALKSQNTKSSLEIVEKIKTLYTQNDIKFDANLNISLREDVKRWMTITENRRLNKNIINERYLLGNRNMRSRHIFENEDEQRFGENKFDHWYDTFTFQKYDEKTGDFKDIETDSLKHGKIKERFNDFIKNYDGDDAFVRAVVDTHPEVSRFKYLKDQANIQEAYYPTGLASILSVIRESKGEYEIFSVSRQKGGNWNLVKGDFTQKEMSNMVLTKQIPPEKKPKERENGLESLKKKEATGANSLRNDEKEGLKNLPKKVKEKVQEKISRGWTTEIPPKVFKDFYKESEISSVFNEKIPIYKLEATPEFFRSLQKNSSHVLVRRGFCRSLLMAKNDSDINSEQRKVVNHILSKCEDKFEGKFGLRYLSKKS